MTPPSTLELMRRLDEAITELRGLRSEIASTYMRQDVYASDQRGVTSAHVAIVNDIEALRAEQVRRIDEATLTRRLVYIAVLTALVLPLIAALILHAMRYGT